MTLITLTKGVIHDIHSGKYSANTFTIQVLAARKFPNGNKHRLLVSDGVHTSGFAVLSSKLSHMVTSGEVGEHTVVKVTSYFCNDICSGNITKKMLVIIDMNVLMTGAVVGKVIGSPVSYDKAVEKGSAIAGSPCKVSSTSDL